MSNRYAVRDTQACVNIHTFDAVLIWCGVVYAWPWTTGLYPNDKGGFCESILVFLLISITNYLASSTYFVSFQFKYHMTCTRGIDMNSSPLYYIHPFVQQHMTNTYPHANTATLSDTQISNLLKLPDGCVGYTKLKFAHMLSDEELCVLTVHKLEPEAFHHLLEPCEAVLDHAIVTCEPPKPLVSGCVPGWQCRASNRNMARL